LRYSWIKRRRLTNRWANIDRVERLLDWKPAIDFDTDMKDMVDLYLENKDWVKELKF
jgi:dTDP-D-glucose 4,6-dehydratase